MEGWTSVFSGPQVEADLVHARLRAAGIRSEIIHRAYQQALPAPSFADSEVLVPRSSLPRARRLVEPAQRRRRVAHPAPPMQRIARRAVMAGFVAILIPFAIFLIASAQR